MIFLKKCNIDLITVKIIIMKNFSYLQEKVNKKIGLNNRSISKFIKINQNLSLGLFFNKFCILNNNKKIIKENIFFLTKIRTFKGLRHKLGYPVRGQRTHTNAKTNKR
jgi:small subunit ribosomal protein S13